MSESELLPVEQVDRDAASWRPDRAGLSTIAAGYRTGKYDNSSHVQDFARHRLTATTPAERLAEALPHVFLDCDGVLADFDAHADELSGMAYSIANDLGFVQSIANAALAVYKEQTNG